MGGVPASFNAKTTVEERRLQDEEIDDSFLSLDEVTDGPPNSPTAASTSTSDSEDTTGASTSASSADCASITDTVCAMEGVTFFCDVLKEMMLIPASTSEDDSSDMSNVTASKYVVRRHLDDNELEVLLKDESKEFTVFVPTDAAFTKVETAFAALTEEEAGRVVMFHFYEGMLLTSDTLECGEKITSMNGNGDASRTKCKGDNKYQNGNGNTKTGTMPEIAAVDMMACNAVIHTLDEVMFPVSLSQLEEADSSDDSSGDMSNVTASKGVLPAIVAKVPAVAGTAYANTAGALGTAYGNTVGAMGTAYGTAVAAVHNAWSF